MAEFIKSFKQYLASNPLTKNVFSYKKEREEEEDKRESKNKFFFRGNDGQIPENGFKSPKQLFIGNEVFSHKNPSQSNDAITPTFGTQVSQPTNLQGFSKKKETDTIQIDKNDSFKENMTLDSKMGFTNFSNSTNFLQPNKIFKPCEYNLDMFEIGRPLGTGKFGHVYLARFKESKAIVALKILYKKQLIESNFHNQFIREIEIHSRLKHENVLEMYGYFWDEKRIIIILEYANKGELYKELRNSPFGKFNEEKSSKYIYQVIQALKYLHGKNIIHRDIKPENLLKDNDTIKLADFGWSVHCPSGKRETICGTIDYLSQEMVNNMKYDEKVDLWCVGILCYEFLVGSPPFENNDQKTVFKKIKKNKVFYPQFLSKKSKNFIRLLLVEDKKRMSISEALNHPFIRDYN